MNVRWQTYLLYKLEFVIKIKWSHLMENVACIKIFSQTTNFIENEMLEGHKCASLRALIMKCRVRPTLF
jgi:hypothetical protein